MGEEYDVPWEYARRAGGVRLSSMRASINEGGGGTMPMVSTTSHDCISSSSTSSLRFPTNEQRSISRDELEDAQTHSLALFRPSSSTEGRGEGRRRSSRGGGGVEDTEEAGRRRRIDETCIRRDMDRVEAEKLLQERTRGDFVMRWREDGISAALSLRAHEGVLHLKIDRVGERWIVGEGARFRSISQAISFYRKNPLPIRGARHICLAECLSTPRTTDARLSHPAPLLSLLLTMEHSGGPVKRSFPVGTRQQIQAATHICFFCGDRIAVALDYQKHIVEHQQAAIAYHIYAQDHPAMGRGREKKEEHSRKRGKDKKGDSGDEKRQKMETSVDVSSYSLSSPVATRDQSLSQFAVPSHPAKTPVAQGRYPASKSVSQAQHTTPAPAEEAASEGQQRNRSLSLNQSIGLNQSRDAHCVVCSVRFQNATELLMHNINEHQATILKVQIVHHYGETVIPANSEFEYTEECEYCPAKTPTLTESFEHVIVHHKGHLMKDTNAEAVTYNITLGVPSKMNFEVRIRLRRGPSKA